MDTRRVATVITRSSAGGLLLGAATQWAQGVLPGNWNVIANSTAAWFLGAVGAGAAAHVEGSPRRRGRALAALCGAVTLAGAVVAYSVSVDLFEYDSGFSRAVWVWLATACIAGPLGGLVGDALRRGSPRERFAAAAAIGGVLVAEGIWLVWRVQRLDIAGWVEIGLGTTVPLLLLRSRPQRAAVTLAVAAFAVLAVIADLVLERAIAG